MLEFLSGPIPSVAVFTAILFLLLFKTFAQQDARGRKKKKNDAR